MLHSSAIPRDDARNRCPGAAGIASWDNTTDWEHASAATVYDQIAQFVDTTAGATTHLTPERKGQFVALCWTGQIYKHIPSPKPAYITPCHELPEWQQRTDIGIFTTIEQRHTPTT